MALGLTVLQELCPLPYNEIEDTLSRYTNRKSTLWAQEEPENAGALSHFKPRLEQIKGLEGITYASRPVCSAPATGVGSVFQLETQQLMDNIFAL